jgi:hypothetical protein
MKNFYVGALVCLSYLVSASAGGIAILDKIINETTIPVAIIESSDNASAPRRLCFIPPKRSVACKRYLPVCAECKGKEGSEAQRMELQVYPLGGAKPQIMTLLFKRVAQWAYPQAPSLMLSAGLQTDQVLLYAWFNNDIKLQRDQEEIYLITLTLKKGDDFSKSSFTVTPRNSII